MFRLDDLIRRVLGESDINIDENFINKTKKYVRNTALGIAVIVTAWNSFYIVGSQSEGVEKRLGKYNRTTSSGINFKIPYVDSVEKLETKQVKTMTFGFRTEKPGEKSTFIGSDVVNNADINTLKEIVNEAGFTESMDDNQIREKATEILQSEYRTLTGDLNMVDVEWICQYRIKNAKDYLFNIADPVGTLRDVNLAVVKQITGNGSVDEALTLGRIEYETESKLAVQALLDKYKSGIEVTLIQFQNTLPPSRVRPAYNEVNEAMQQKQTRINQAKQEYNKVIPKARGDAQKTISEAEGYSLARVNNALGDVARFNLQREEYRKAPEITKQRLWFETMGEVLPEMGGVIMEQKGAEGGILNKYNINQK